MTKRTGKLRARRVTRLVAVIVAAGLAATAIGDGAGAAEGDQQYPPVDQPGVTDDTIRVGGVTSTTNAIQGKYGEAYDGVKAYFAMINSKGGIYGRDLKVVAERDDNMTNNRREVQALLDQDNIFAALPMATIFQFSGADLLQDQGVPTFGWNINAEFTDKDALFGDRPGLCFDCPGPALPWLARKLGKKSVAVLAYNSTPSSRDCAKGVINSFKEYKSPAKVNFVDDALTFGVTDFSVQVGKMKDENVDFVTTCMDLNGVFNLQKELRKQRVRAVQYLPDGYDQEFMKENGKLFAGSIVLTGFAPFETKPRPKGLKNYLKWIKKTGGSKNTSTMTGWINADQFVTGLKAAGPDFTRQKVIDAINNGPEFTAGGLLPGLDWSTAHSNEQQEIECPGGFVEVESDGSFKPVFTKGDKPFPCFRTSQKKVPKNPVEYR
jgi:ABC-type branched-subunit amino acid transport system substrate-binding protein